MDLRSRNRFASEEARADRRVVLEAVAQDGHALEFAAPELRADPEIVTRGSGGRGRGEVVTLLS